MQGISVYPTRFTIKVDTSILIHPSNCALLGSLCNRYNAKFVTTVLPKADCKTFARRERNFVQGVVVR